MLDEKGEPVAGRTAACRLFDAQVADYLDGEDRPAVVVHASECAFCAVVLADLRTVISESAALGFEEPPPRVWANIRAASEVAAVIDRRNWSLAPSRKEIGLKALAVDPVGPYRDDPFGTTPTSRR